MEPLTEANAADALRAAIDADAADAAGTSPEPVVTQPSEVELGATAPEPQVDEDSFTRADLTALLDGVTDPVARERIERAYSSFQGDYTRKMQEFSPARREIEAFGGIDRVRQALEFVSNLQDPDNLVQFHGELSQYLQANGMTKVEADAEASRQVQAASTDSYEDYDEYDNDPRDAALQREVAELREWRESFERERQAEAMERELIRQENFIRTEFPHYKDEDIKACYAMSWAYGGDLLQAQEQYEADRQRIIESYASQKAAAVPPAVAPPSAGPGGQVPQSFGSDFDAAHEYAKERLRALQSMGALD